MSEKKEEKPKEEKEEKPKEEKETRWYKPCVLETMKKEAKKRSADS